MDAAPHFEILSQRIFSKLEETQDLLSLLNVCCVTLWQRKTWLPLLFLFVSLYVCKPVIPVLCSLSLRSYQWQGLWMLTEMTWSWWPTWLVPDTPDTCVAVTPSLFVKSKTVVHQHNFTGRPWCCHGLVRACLQRIKHIISAGDTNSSSVFKALTH